jgi:23S rRNA A1618 N6-methylase RlmF
MLKTDNSNILENIYNEKDTYLSCMCLPPLLTHAETTKTSLAIEQQKQAAGFYQYQSGETQITALLDGTNFMSPTLFKDIPQKQVHEILKNTMLIKRKAYKPQ